MSQPCNANCNTDLPGQLDSELNEFWSGNPWEIFEKHNLSCYERNRLYLSSQGKTFVDVSFLSGTDSDGDARCVLPLDYNLDGQMDLMVRGTGGGAMMLYENRFPKHTYLKVSLIGKLNRQGVGARITAQLANGSQIVRERYPTNSHHSQRPLVVHFGLGTADHVKGLEIRWPDGKVQKLGKIAADQHVLIEQGNDKPRKVEPGKVGTLAPR